MTRLDTTTPDRTHGPIPTDEDIRRRVTDLLRNAVRRQWWTLYLDEQDVQQPVLMPMAGYPEDPYAPCGAEGTVVDVLADRLASIVGELGAAKVVFVWERPGGDELTPGDREWAGALGAACRAAGVDVRAQLIVHDGGVRWITPDDV